MQQGNGNRRPGRASTSTFGRLRLAGLAALVAAAALLGLPKDSSAAPIVYGFQSGTVTLRAVLDDAPVNTNVLAGGSPVEILLGGTSVTFDPAAGSFGTLTGLLLIPAATINLDLSGVALDTVSIENASLINQLGSFAELNEFGQFTIPTVVSADVSGFLTGGVPFGPAPSVSDVSSAAGLLGVTGDALTLGLTGVNIARFPQLAGSGPDVIVKADFTFIGVVPEPGTAILLGLGLGGLSAVRRRGDSRR